MSFVNRDRTDGRYVGSKAVGGASWVDLAMADLDTATAEAIPSSARIVDLFVYNAGEADAFLLLCPHGAKSDGVTTGALIVPAGQGRSFGLNLPDAAISTISVLGAVRVEAILV